MDPKRIELLHDSRVFPETAETVEVVQTHLSVVCLVGDFAYKLKKAIRLPFADFTTLKNRRKYCEEELRLNRRLCPDVYLSVEELREDSQGRPTFCGEGGPVIDYAVKMRRLPADRMMDVLLESNSVTKSEIEKLARVVAAFHARADRGDDIDRYGNPDSLARFADENFEETERFVGGIYNADLHGALWRKTGQEFMKWLPALRRRLAEGRVVDGHGDLHARNICLTDPVAIYDCIEFEPAFRCGDVALEHAFLLMDLRFRGHPELAGWYLDEIEEETRDEEMRDLLPTLMGYRAMVRSKVSAITACEPEIEQSDREAMAAQARQYMRLAAGIAVEEQGPLWIMMCGLPGAGKSTVARELQKSVGWPILSSDRIRKELAGYDEERKLPDEYYSGEFSEKTYREIEVRAQRTHSVVCLLDANYRTRESRAVTRAAAENSGIRLAIVYLDPGEAALRNRLHKRAGEPNVVSDADVAVLEKLSSRFEPPEAIECDLLIEITEEGRPEDIADRILARICERNE